MENQEEEVWSNIEGYEGNYHISNYGRLKSMPRLKKKHVSIDLPLVLRTGYRMAHLSLNGKCKSVFAHILVATYFVEGKTDLRKFVNHKDGDKQNNYYKNLEWVTHTENMRHAFSLGLNSNVGIRNSNVKLTEAQVLEIRQLYFKYTYKDIAKMYNLCFSHVAYIVKGYLWSQLPVLDYSARIRPKRKDAKSF